MTTTKENTSNQPSDDTIQYVTFAPRSYLETDVLKDSNNNAGKGRFSPKSPRIRRFISSMTSPKTMPKVNRTNSAKMYGNRTSQDGEYSSTNKNRGNHQHPTSFTNDGFNDLPSLKTSLKYNTVPARDELEQVERLTPQLNLTEQPVGFHTAPRQHILPDYNHQVNTLPNDYTAHNKRLPADHENQNSTEFEQGLLKESKPHISFSPPEYDGFHMNTKTNSYTVPRDYESGLNRTSYHPPSERLTSRTLDRRGTLTKREMKDLNALLGEFGEDKLDSPESHTDDELIIEQQKSLSKLANQFSDQIFLSKQFSGKIDAAPEKGSRPKLTKKKRPDGVTKLSIWSLRTV